MKATIISVSLIAILSTVLAACGQMIGPGQQGHMMNMPFGGMFMILVLIALVLFVVLVLKGVTQGNRNDGKPLDILKNRYARGEIDKAEYERMKKELTDD